MFETLAGKLGSVFDRLRQRGALNETDVMEALREVRLALLDADVALDVVRDFVAKVRKRAVGQEVLASVSPGRRSSKSFMTCWSRRSAVPAPCRSTSRPWRRCRS